MHLPTLFAVALSLVGGAQAAGCYSRGARGDRDWFKVNARRFCESLGGTYSSYQVKFKCNEQPSGNVHWDVSWKNNRASPASRKLDIITCITKIWTESDGCEYGGENGWSRDYLASLVTQSSFV